MSDAGLLIAASKDVLNLKGEAAVNNAGATAQGYAIQGSNIEAGTYGQAADIATGNAQLEAASSTIQQYQEQRQINEATGTIAADTAGSGFKTSGSALAAIRTSTQQGDLAQQLIKTNSQISQQGYLAQALASKGEASAAGVSANAAAALQNAYTNAATTATTEATNETAALMGLLASTGDITGTPGSPGSTARTPTGALALSALNGPTSTLKWTQGPNGWTFGSGTPSVANNGTGASSSPDSFNYNPASDPNSVWYKGSSAAGFGMRGSIPIGVGF